MSEKSWRNRVIMGSAFGAAAIAVAIDHTRHTLPTPVADDSAAVVIMEEGGEDSPCALGSPCALDSAPCALDASPCALDASPCSL